MESRKSFSDTLFLRARIENMPASVHTDRNSAPTYIHSHSQQEGMNSATSLSRSSGGRTCGVGAQSGEQLVADVTVHAHHLPYIHTCRAKKGQRRKHCHDVIAFHSLYNSNTLASPHTHSYTNKTNTQRHTASKQSIPIPATVTVTLACMRKMCVRPSRSGKPNSTLRSSRPASRACQLDRSR